MASAKLKSQIDNLVERAIKEKLEVQAKEKNKQEKDEARKWIADQVRDDDAVVVNAGEVLSGAEKIVTRQPEIASSLLPDGEAPRNDNAEFELSAIESAIEEPEEKDLAEILNNNIASPEARFIADFVEPEIRLQIKLRENLNREAKDFLKQQSVAAGKAKAEANKEKLTSLSNALKSLAGGVSFFAALIARAVLRILKNILSLRGSASGRSNLTDNRPLPKQAIREIASPGSSPGLKALAMTLQRFVASLNYKARSPAMTIAAAKEKVKQALTFKPRQLKTAAVAIAIVLAITALNHFAPGAAADFSRMAKRTAGSVAAQFKGLADSALKSKYLARVEQAGEKVNPVKSQFAIGALRVFNGVKKMPEQPGVIIPGRGIAVKTKSSLDNFLVRLADNVSAASLSFEDDFSRRNQILAARLGAIKNQVSFIAGFWNEQLARPTINLKLAAGLLPGKATRISRQSLAMLTGFINYQGASMGEVAYLAKDKLNPLNSSLRGERARVKENQGRVAGAAEAATGLPAQAGPSPMSRLLALANTTSRRGQEVINQFSYSAGNVL
ncbi:MAG: hypothetical protein WC651_05680, partial [Candidatus Gracilibacteria bacterium]